MPFELEKPVCPSVEVSGTPSAQGHRYLGPCSLGPLKLSYAFCPGFLPRAALDCSLADGYWVLCFSEKPMGSFTQMLKSPGADALGEGAAQLARLPAWCLPRGQQWAHHSLSDALSSSTSVTGKGDTDLADPALTLP